MVKFLEEIRRPADGVSRKRQLFYLLGCLLLGAVLGGFSKFLDGTASNHLPWLFQVLDITNFLGRFAVWIFLAVLLSVKSGSPFWAAGSVFAFFVGMIVSYYLYTYYIAGFFPRSYVMIWVGFTLVSPFLAFVCWYAVGRGPVALLIASGILSILFNLTFSYGAFYFDIPYFTELLVFLLAGWLLRRRGWKQTLWMLAAAVVIAFLLHWVPIPFRLW